MLSELLVSMFHLIKLKTEVEAAEEDTFLCIHSLASELLRDEKIEQMNLQIRGMYSHAFNSL